MRAIQVELPDTLAQELDTIVADGWFSSEGDIVRLALLEFVRNNRRELIERFQREDIAWALSQRDTAE